MEVFSDKLSLISERGQYRVGARYRSVWVAFQGRVFKSAKMAYPTTALSKLVRPYWEVKTLPKGELDEERVLIDLEDIEDRHGRIRKERSVSSIGSDKIVFGDCDILFSKLRPYLGKVVINDPKKDYIGTTELLPFKVRDGVNVNYVKYLMLSEDFLGMATRMMYGKEHPRVDAGDLLSLIVPNPPPHVQDDIVETLEAQVESKVDRLKTGLVPLQDAIEESFVDNGVKEASGESQSFKTYLSRFSSFGSQRFVRCGARYRHFWDVSEGKVIENSSFALDRFGTLANMIVPETLARGELESEYIEVDLPDIIPLEGRLTKEERLVSSIGSDKVVFGDADILYSQIDPFLGHVILNDRSKPYIGTTELIPLKAREGVDFRYLRYLLLSRDFLEVSQNLMYGKRHPRIHYLDVLNMRVPCPELKTQKKVSDEIWGVEASNIERNKEIDSLYSQVEPILLANLTSR
ncbi:MAG: hypothetical protein JRM73_04775 [Nitrososphaerota archaeon]|nr:hypothetical protein [Nitrososphaerota archaeon]